MENIKNALLDIEFATLDNADPIAKEVLDETQKSIGFIPNMYFGMGTNPALLDSYNHGYLSFRTNSGFTMIEQEVIFLTISYENECDYCMGAHSFVADQMSNVPFDVTEALRNGSEITDSKLEALRKFTKEMLVKKGRPAPEEIDNFLTAGYTKRDVLGIVTAIGVKIMSNYFNHLADTELDAVFSQRAWSK